MEEPWAVNPLVPVRLRPVTPKRMLISRVANSSGREPGSYPGWSGFKPLATHHRTTPRGGMGRRTGLRNRSPQGVSVRLGPRGPITINRSKTVNHQGGVPCNLSTKTTCAFEVTCTSGWPQGCRRDRACADARAYESLPRKANAHRSGVRTRVRLAGVRHPDSSVDAVHAAPLESADAAINGLHREVPSSILGWPPLLCSSVG